MAWPNDSTSCVAIRKASRPLSIIDENPDDFKCHPKKYDDSVSAKQLASRPESRSVESPRSSAKPTRRKAVAPLQHPIDLLLSNDVNSNAGIDNRNYSDNTSNQNGSRDETKPVLSTQDDVSCSANDVTNSRINGNWHVCDKQKEGGSEKEIKIHFNKQRSDIEDLKSQHLLTGVLDNYNRPNDHRRETHGVLYNCNGNISATENDTKYIDENGNENIRNIFELMSRKPSDNSSQGTTDASRRSDMTSDNGDSFHQKKNAMFYLSNSTSSLSGNDEEEEVKKKIGRNVINSIGTKIVGQSFTNGKLKDSGDADTEQTEWKNRVKKSRSFIKHKNSLRPMRRSISATFGDSVSSGNDRISTPENYPYSPGSMRRSRSQQVDVSYYRGELYKSKTFMSLFGDTIDKSKSDSLSNEPSKAHNIKAAPASQGKEQTSSQSNDGPIRRISAIDQSDFRLLEVTANRLHLQTRRPSVMAWKEKYLQSSLAQNSRDGHTDSTTNEREKMTWTQENVERINASLSMLKRELIELRLQDQSLARQFLGLRHTMNSLRLTLQCKDHKDLLDDAEEDIEEFRELSQLVDLPPELFSPVSSLQNLGITRMNISSRRFSTC